MNASGSIYVNVEELAAAQNNATAQTNIGELYHHSLGVAQDYAEAMRWYQLAASQTQPNIKVLNEGCTLQ